MHADIIFQIAVAIVVATGFAFLAKLTRQPLILAYVAAGVVVGQTEGFGWVNTHDIEPISELGLILLLFMIGLEIDLKKLRQAGAAVLAAGFGQFLICVLLGLAVAPLLGFGYGQGNFAPLYLAVAAALSSTMIVVKLLYDKFELDTIPGRVTLGILVIQDICAILFLALQHDLKNPAPLLLVASLAKGIGVVLFALLASRYVLPVLFRSVAKLPELVMISALAWCFGISMLAAKLGLSREMGALIAGTAISTFPYNLDVVAKIVSLRDFFITLFFVSLGTRIPRPDTELVVTALGLSGFLVASRFLSISPILYLFRSGNRVSFIPALNLSQISEFSLVIGALGVSLGHINEGVLSVIVLTLVITSVASTYGILYNHEIFSALNPLLKRLGVRDRDTAGEPGAPEPKPVVFLGFSRYASTLLVDLLERRPQLASAIRVIDFNPEVKDELDRRGIACTYGDISHNDVLHHAAIEQSRVVVCTLADHILKGTTNLRLTRQLAAVAPHAKHIATAEFFYTAHELYREGADFVFVPRLMSVKDLAEVVLAALDGRFEDVRAAATAELEHRQRAEVLP